MLALGQKRSTRFCGQLESAGSTFAENEPNPMEAASRPSAHPFQRNSISILQEGARLAVGQADRRLAALREFQQRPSVIRTGAGQGARTEQVTRRQVQPFTVWWATSCATAQ